MRDTSPEHRAFTLIELLVVISIIALLVAILVPSIQAARELAKRMPCATNMRSMGIGVSMYAGDNQEAVPPRDYFWGPSVMSAQWQLWGDKIVQYFDSSARPAKPGERSDYASSVGCQPASGNYGLSFGQDPNIRYSRAMNCVAQKNTDRYHYGWTFASWGGRCTGWKMPATTPYDVKTLPYFRPVDYCTVVEPACQFRAPIMSANMDIPYFASEQSKYIDYVTANAPHRQTFNGLMLDGHVVNYAIGDLTTWFAQASNTNFASYPFNVPQ